MYTMSAYFSTRKKPYRKPKHVLKEIAEFIIYGEEDEIIAYWAAAQIGQCFCILLVATT